MRLIDADRYKEELESLIEICDFEGENDVKEGIQSAIHTLDSENFTPTVDAEPIRHGHWFDEEVEEAGGIYTYTRCSVCGEYEVSGIESPYCPWCGASMDEEVEE